MAANDKIMALVKPEYLERVPRLFRGHAKSGTCKLIAREYPELYAKAEAEGDLPTDVANELSKIVNGIFEERMAKHDL
ncbi:hypothetical protein IYQ92_00665 [Streptococcus sp. HF-1907]|uniref:hypothetical protein n=1 Tax=Streptococcus sp. HF-1907 TaxID=2785793 RepID=UPI00189C768C|nr:hypothetical protein [Streptococcus sp. HF-1907]MBF7093811.1 hypothetical protein [Streptococcus sp. HF-1907]